jgi:hypothetical protein
MRDNSKYESYSKVHLTREKKYGVGAIQGLNGERSSIKDKIQQNYVVAYRQSISTIERQAVDENFQRTA